MTYYGESSQEGLSKTSVTKMIKKTKYKQTLLTNMTQSNTKQ